MHLLEIVLTWWFLILAAQQNSLEAFRKVLLMGSKTSNIVTHGPTAHRPQVGHIFDLTVHSSVKLILIL